MPDPLIRTCIRLYLPHIRLYLPHIRVTRREQRSQAPGFACHF